MSYPDPKNPYGFDGFLDWRENCDYFAEDFFAQEAVRVFTGDRAAEVDAAAREVSVKASFRCRKMAESIAWPEKRPWMMHYDGHGNRIDRIVRPHETEEMEQEVFGEALFSDKTDPWVRFVKMYLIYQNGEACISCPLSCTEGLVAVLERFADSSEIQAIVMPSWVDDGRAREQRNGFAIDRIKWKMATSFDAPEILRLAMSLFGGHGVMEDFSALPRLYRDAAVNELWERPRNVLLAQVHRDLEAASAWYAPDCFVANILAGTPEDLVKEPQQ